MKEYYQGEVFKDSSEKGKDRKWKERKINNINLAKAFEELEYKIARMFFHVLKFCDTSNKRTEV